MIRGINPYGYGPSARRDPTADHRLAATGVKTASYTAAAGELVLCDATAAGFAVTLPTTPALGGRVNVKKLDSTTNAVTVTCGGSDLIVTGVGSTSPTASLSVAEAREFVFDGTSRWIVASGQTPLSVLDARYAAGPTPVHTSRTADQAGWQAALDEAIASGGGVVRWLPGSGTVNLSSPLLVPDGTNVPLVIMAEGVIVRPATGQPAFKVITGWGNDGGTRAAYNTVRGSRISGLQIADLRGAGSQGYGIHVENSMNWTFDGIYVTGCVNQFSIINNGTGFFNENHTFRGCYGVGASNDCVHMENQNSANVSLDGIWFDNCGMASAGQYNINWGQNLAMHGGGFRNCKTWSSVINTTSVLLDGLLRQGLLDLEFDNTNASATGVTGVMIGPHVPLGELVKGKMRLVFTGAGPWTNKIGFDGSALELNAVWEEGGKMKYLGTNTTTTPVIGIQNDAQVWPSVQLVAGNGTQFGQIVFGSGNTQPTINLYGSGNLTTDATFFAGGGLLEPINNQAGAAYTAALTDRARILTMTSASANTVTIPPNSSVAFAVGDKLRICQYGAGVTTVAAGAGVTIVHLPAATMTQYEEWWFRKIATDTWRGMRVGE